jgi:hypothetical protein
MPTSDKKNYRSNLNEVLEEAQISILERASTQGGMLYELEPSQCGGRRGLVFDNKDKGVTVAVRIEIPEASPIRSRTTSSPEALQLLGALTLTLQGSNAEARLISGERGLEGVIVSQHLCPQSVDASNLGRYLNRLHELVKQIEPTLSLSGQMQTDSIFERVRSVIAEVRKDVPTETAVIVPTFDEAQRNRMMQQTQ